MHKESISAREIDTEYLFGVKKFRPKWNLTPISKYTYLPKSGQLKLNFMDWILLIFQRVLEYLYDGIGYVNILGGGGISSIVYTAKVI